LPNELAEARIALSSAAGPFDLASTLTCGQVFRWHGGEDGWWQGVIQDRAVWVRQETDALMVRSSLPEEGSLRRYFRLDDDLEAIYRSFPQDPRLDAAVVRYRGLRLIRQDPWDCAVSFVCATFCHVPRIRRMVDALCRNYGDPIGWEQFGSPRPERLAGATESELRALGLGYRALNVLDLARRVEDGRLDLDELRKKPYQEATAKLRGVRGIGHKVADCVALFSLDHLSAVPVDVWMERVLKARAPELRSYKELADFARVEFGPFAGYAQQYLFHQARMEPGERELCRTSERRCKL